MARRIAPLAAAALLLIWHTLQYNFVTDDAYISFVFARNLAEHGALVFNASDLAHPVEGYTNFLWTLLLALFMLVGLAPEVSSLIFGAAFAIATLVVVFRIAERMTEGRENPIAGLASVLLASSASYACWASGGLETQMFTFFVALAILFVARAEENSRSFRWVGVALALAAMTRPEGLLVAAVVGGHRLLANALISRRFVPIKNELLAAALFLVIWTPWFAWRWWYYGFPFPNTYYVKAAGEASARYVTAMRENGLHYVWTWAGQSKALILSPLILVGAFAHRPRSLAFRLGALMVVLSLVYLGYAYRVGGDFMGLHRFVMPVTVMCLVLAAVGVVRVSELLARHFKISPVILAVVLAAALAGGFAFTQLATTRKAVSPANLASDRGIDTPAYLDLYARDRAKIGKHMRECFRPSDFSIFGGVGAKPYFARAEGIDVFGLVSDRIAHEVPRTRPRAGHNKWGPDKLLLEHDPDFVFSCYSIHREAKKPRWNCSPSTWIRRGYEPITLHIPGLEARGEFYTFLAKKKRHFSCPGQVR